ncbi:MAG TPA: ATP-binding cassette domain-containing protein [Lachnospiraceae bacterium]
MGKEIIRVTNLGKNFGKTEILHDINISVEEGEICGIVGRNGSGKTVLFKCICGLLRASCGEIFVNAKDIGVIIEEPGFLKHYSGLKNLQYLAELSGKRDVNFKEILQIVGLWGDEKKRVGKYSLGMKQRLGIAQAIMENQSILLLDEPMNGLDNQGVEDMRVLFQRLSDEGKTILLASHNRDDIDILCNHVYEMDRGYIKKIR